MRRATCVPISCREYPGCQGCKEMPDCLPMNNMDRAYSWNEDEFAFAFSRSLGDNNIGLLPDHWYPGQACSLFGSKGLHPKEASIPWAKRVPGAVWRGALSGGLNTWQRQQGVAEHIKVDRAIFARRFWNSTWINVTTSTRQPLPGFGAGAGAKQDYGLSNQGRLSPAEMMRHRCIVYLEGNDVGSSAYWLFGSGSLVLAPKVLTSESMFRLRPFVNYVPFANDLSDVERVVSRYCGNGIRTADWVRNLSVTGCASDNNLSPDDMHCQHYEERERREQRYPDRLANFVRDWQPTELVQNVLHHARSYFDDMCDDRREAQRVYQILKMYKQRTHRASLTLPAAARTAS